MSIVTAAIIAISIGTDTSIEILTNSIFPTFGPDWSNC